MFQIARLKLTAWYLLIIMMISLLFSFVIFASITRELSDLKQMQKVRQDRVQERFGFVPVVPGDPTFDDSYFDKARDRVIITLSFINGAILLISGTAGYFLAGRTLRPIQKMVDEQKRFVSDASHELRTPLTSLRSEIEVSLRDPKMKFSDVKDLLKSNLEEVIHLQNLSDNLLSLAQNGQQSADSIISTFPINKAITAARKKINGIIKKKKIEIHLDVSDYNVTGMYDRIVELFVILLDNAVKYSPANSSIHISGKEKKDQIEISIKDEGIGISGKELPYIFDRFYRVNKSRETNDVPGYGLGLSIAQKIVISHGGTIEVRSTINKGSTFKILLPIKD